MAELLLQYQSLEQFNQSKLLAAFSALKIIGIDSHKRLTLMAAKDIRRLRRMLRNAGFNYGESLEIASRICDTDAVIHYQTQRVLEKWRAGTGLHKYR